MLLVIKRTGDIQMNDLNDTAKHHHLQYSGGTIKNHVFYYRRYAPKELTH
ncbi:IS982 family transposase, partial [Streptococcus mutans]